MSATPSAMSVAAAIGGAAEAAPRQFDETAFNEIGARPVEPVDQHRLAAARQQALAILGGDAQRLDDLVLERGDR